MGGLSELCDIKGFRTIEDLLDDAEGEELVHGICTNLNCDYTEKIPYNCDESRCPTCNEYTVVACTVLAKET